MSSSSDEHRWLTGIVLIVLVLLLKGFFAACESAVTEVPDGKIRAMAGKKGGEGALYKLHRKPARLLTTFAVNRALSNVVAAYLAAVVFHQPLEDFLLGFWQTPPGEPVLTAVAFAAFCLLTVVSTLALVVLTDSLPKRLVGKKPEKMAVLFAPLVLGLEYCLLPLTAACNLFTGLIAALLGKRPDFTHDVVTEEEILMMVDAGSETGVIEDVQKEMISNIFEFGDLEVSDLMTHRTDMTAVDISASVSQVVHMAINSGKSRIPVYSGDIDKIAGVINVKDLLALIGCVSTEDFSIRDFLREALFVPATGNCQEVFQRMTASKAQLAIAVDEYGGTAGLLTMEDLLEAIVGNIQDEYDNEQEECVEVSDGVYILSGTADPEILERLDLTLPQDHGYDTLSGFFIDQLGRIPDENETPSVEWEGVVFTALVIGEQRVDRLKAAVLNPLKKEQPVQG